MNTARGNHTTIIRHVAQKIGMVVLSVSILWWVALGNPSHIFAQTLSFDPTQLGVVVGQKFTVKININTGGQPTGGTDAIFTYDSSILKVVSVSNGGFYTNYGANPVSGTNNKYVINTFEQDSTSTKTGTGTIAIVTFEGIANGTSTVSFDCSPGSDTDSNIIKANTSDDIINCGAMATASYTVGPANATPITNGTSNGPTPSVLPRSGSTEVGVIAVGIGIVLTIVGILVKL